MRIIYIDKGRMPTEKAHGYQISKMCEEFSRLGNDVCLLVPDRYNLIKEDVFDYYSLDEKFELRKIAIIDFFKYLKGLYKLSFYLVSILFFLRLAFLKVDKKAIIYSRAPEIIWLFGLRGNRTIFEAHSWPVKKSGLYTFFIKKASGVVVVTERLKALFISHGIDESKLMVASDGVDPEVFDIEMSKDEARRHLGLPDHASILGYTGSFKTMDRDKGIATILESLNLISVSRKNVRFIAVGGSKADSSYYLEMTKKLGVEQMADFKPRVALKELAIFQKACDILLMPFPNIEHYAYYMSPLKMFEYMSSRRPLIASDLPSVRDVLNEKNCTFVRPDDPGDLAAKISKILDNPESAVSKYEQALIDARKYSWTERARSILTFINK